MNNEIRTKKRYNLFNSMQANNTILLVDRIGYNHNSLIKLCKKLDINTIDQYGNTKGYGTLVKEYLIKVKVGY